MKTETMTGLGRRLAKVSGVTVAVALLALLVLPGKAADQLKGGQKLMQLNPIKTVEEAQAVKPGDMVVMSCPKCKDVWVTYVDTEAKGGQILAAGGKPTKTALKHLCPGCETTTTRTGMGKQGKDVIVHVCKKCGSEDAFCCVLNKGDAPTKGMEKK